MTRRDRIVILAVLIVAALGGFWMLVLKPKQEQAAKLGKDLDAAQQRLSQARSELDAGSAARAGYSANYAAVARLGKAVPSDDNVPSLVYQLDSTAQVTGVDFRSVKLASGSGTPAPAAPAPAAASAGQPASSGSSTTSTTKAPASPSAAATPTPANPTPASTAPAAPTQAATAGLPPGATVGPAGLSTMPFSFKFSGNFFRLDSFLSRLESYITARREAVDVSGRLLLINGISLTAGDGGFPRMSASVAATAYLVPSAQGTFNGATPTGPSATVGAQPAATSTPAPAPTATVKP
jgi:hypothetical protein